MRSIYADELPPDAPPACLTCCDTGLTDRGAYCHCGPGRRAEEDARDAAYLAIREVIRVSHDFDGPPLTVRLTTPVCCPSCEVVSQVVRPVHGTRLGEWVITCPHCLDVWGTK